MAVLVLRLSGSCFARRLTRPLRPLSGGATVVEQVRNECFMAGLVPRVSGLFPHPTVRARCASAFFNTKEK
jgi:hypothetical protein